MWLVFTKDQMPFRCNKKCAEAKIYWFRVIKTTASDELAMFSEFVWAEELGERRGAKLTSVEKLAEKKMTFYLHR